MLLDSLFVLEMPSCKDNYISFSSSILVSCFDAVVMPQWNVQKAICCRIQRCSLKQCYALLSMAQHRLSLERIALPLSLVVFELEDSRT